MAQRNSGKYPAEKVVSMLNFGPGSQAHGALDMPTWGPLSHSLDWKGESSFVSLRVHKLTQFIESIQEK